MFKQYLQENPFKTIPSIFSNSVLAKNGATTIVFEGLKLIIYYHLEGVEPRKMIKNNEMMKVEKRFTKNTVKDITNVAKKFEKLFDQLFTNLGSVPRKVEQKVDVVFVNYDLFDDEGKRVRTYVHEIKDKPPVIFFNREVIGEEYLIHWFLHEYSHCYWDLFLNGKKKRIVKNFINDYLVGKDPEELIKDKYIVRKYSLKSEEEFFADTIMVLAWNSYGLNDEVVKMLSSIL